jgi:hypothetical protein
MTSSAESWIPAFAGMTSLKFKMDSSFRWNDEQEGSRGIPASGGVTSKLEELE